jgi:lipopolysaccharide transport system ATP-binding protein
MSSDYAILVEGLSKRYVLRHQRDARDGFRHRIEEAFRRPFRALAGAGSAPDPAATPRPRTTTREEFWALSDVSFNIGRGDAVAVIGRNGAGKSTLLKILSRITEPTQGRIRLRGRVASLLEVGTGFHQELSGRENIYLNGAILGMTKAEIKRKFDEIVAFSEVEKFLDTPVKRYSSGMYVRLAFAVAAHLEPEILIIDEVLAVGDAAFQKKCLGKMGQVADSGRTVLFVSHNMGAIQALCKKAIYLKGGRVKNAGDITPVVQEYLSDTGASTGRKFSKPVLLGESLVLENFEFSPNPVESGQSVRFSLVFRSSRSITFRGLVMLIDSAQSARVALVDLRSLEFPRTLSPGQPWRIDGSIRALPFVEGEYSVGLTVDAGDFFENVFELTGITVVPREATAGHVPIPVSYRGVVELDTTLSTSD